MKELHQDNTQLQSQANVRRCVTVCVIGHDCNLSFFRVSSRDGSSLTLGWRKRWVSRVSLECSLVDDELTDHYLQMALGLARIIPARTQD